MLAEGQSDEMLALVEKLLRQMLAHNARLELRLAALLREKFGRRTEKLDPAQLSLFLSALGEAEATAGAGAQTPSTSDLPTPPKKPDTEKPHRPGHGRKPLPDHLPRIEHELPLSAELRTCSCCGKERRVIGTEASEVLDYEPGGFRVLVYRRPTAVADCDCAGTPAFVTAPAPDRVIDGGLPGPGLLAHVIVSKFVDHVPYERQAGIYKREGVEIAPSTLVDWGAAGALMLLALAERIRELALVAYLLQSDDTGLTVLDRDHPKGRKRGHIWVYVGDRKWAAFVYTPDWKADGPTEFLESRVGPVQVDGYGGYKRTFQGPHAKAWEVGCWMHCRRYWKKALDAKDLRAAVALEHIARLYEVERLANEDQVSVEERLRRRQEYSRPAYEQLGRWIRELRSREPPKSLLGKAITYTVNHWTALGRFLEDGRLPLDNGESERQLRKVALGRANYLFAGSDEGGKRAAIFYTVVGTCLLNGVEPFAYLRDVLGKIAAGWPRSRLDELLPPKWAAAQKQAQQEARPA